LPGRDWPIFPNRRIRVDLFGIEAGAALALIKEARGVSVPDTDEQRDWIMAFGKTYQRP
jgi:hypothetical protein